MLGIGYYNFCRYNMHASDLQTFLQCFDRIQILTDLLEFECQYLLDADMWLNTRHRYETLLYALIHECNQINADAYALLENVCWGVAINKNVDHFIDFTVDSSNFDFKYLQLVGIIYLNNWSLYSHHVVNMSKIK